MIKCNNCQTENDDNARMCNLCGQVLSGAPQAQQAQRPVPPPAQPGMSPSGVPRAMPNASPMPARQPLVQKTNGFAIASLILGLLGCTAPLGLIAAIIALVQIGDERGATRGRGLAFGGLAVSIVVLILILPAILFPVFSKSRGKARQVACMSRQRQIALTINMYAAENLDVLPAGWAGLQLSTEQLQCPSAAKSTANSYGLNQNILGQKIEGNINLSTIVLTADSDKSDNLLTSAADIATDRHQKQFVASYLDGHCDVRASTDGLEFMLVPMHLPQ